MKRSYPYIYDLKRPQYKFFFQLLVFRDESSMQLGIRKYHKSHGIDGGFESIDRTLAQFSPYVRRCVTEDDDGLFGYMFLNEKNLGVGIVAHECLHAAFAYDRFINGFDACYGDGQHRLDDEERLAYLLTDYTRLVYAILYEKKHIK